MVENELVEVYNQLQDLVYCDELNKVQYSLDDFNVFSVLKIANNELKHSNVIAWLLDPNENHGLHELFLSKFLQYVYRLNEIKTLSISKILGLNFSKVEIRREWKNIDILVIIYGQSEADDLVIIIENKIMANERKNKDGKIGQLEKYLNICKEYYDKATLIPVFLTLDGKEASDENSERWNLISYKDIISILDFLLDNSKMGSKSITLFLEQYIKTLRRSLMEEKELKELSTIIYTKYKKAIDYIYFYKNDVVNQIRDAVLTLVKKVVGDNIVNDTKGSIEFISDDIKNYQRIVLSPDQTQDLLKFGIYVSLNDVYLRFFITNIGDQVKRNTAYQCCREDQDVFNNVKKPELPTKEWTTVFSKKIYSKKSHKEEEDTEKIINIISDNINKFLSDEYIKINNHFKKKVDELNKNA